MDNDLDFLEFRTDLAIENVQVQKSQEIEGVCISKTTYTDDILVTKVSITNENAKMLFGKPIGDYVTIECDKLKDADSKVHEKLIEILAMNLRDICNIEQVQSVLVVGLGNLYVTTDSLGKKVCQKLLVTRHFYEEAKKNIKGIRNVSVLTPDVLGNSGIESSVVVKNIVNEVKPDLVVVVDALCARDFNRINSTIQISNTGISPGSGVNNKRIPIDEESIGVKVISIGVPTVIDTKTLVKDLITDFFDENSSILNETILSNGLKRDIISEMLKKMSVNMFVSSKEIDEVIVRLSSLISRSLNKVFHDGLTDDEIINLLY